ncbi:putative toxin-antitoxin system toxin component, PIN family [Candidatus Roizmanbacteria bacterium]|nr:putative toxin-antitoxin system toxin component, PIN family [Candidatus Roizmanbacteria bacterium]
MITVFIDTSVLFSACLSKIGSAALVLGYCRKNKIKGFISRYVLSEVKRNATQKLDQLGKQRLNFYILQSNLNIVDNPTFDEIKICQEVINPKDAPILAAAVKNKTNYLITFNTKDFLLPKVKDFAKSLTILTPRDFVILIK